MSYDLRRNVILELKLQVQRAKFIKLSVEVERFLAHYENKAVSAEDVCAAANRLKEIVNELQNSAPNLHGE